MTHKETSYIAKKADKNGLIAYTDEENAVWQTLMERQSKIVQGRGCDEYMHGLQLLDLPKNRIPQCQEISDVLFATTGWNLEPVSALISFDRFFDLLARRRFPAATFIRRRDEIDYLQEPDIFHEVFGHCPLLTNQAYADFTYTYGNLGLHANAEDRAMLARLYWFTIEFGLIKQRAGLRAYGGGILSSMSETVYCLESNVPIRKPFDVLDALRTPYRIDVMQPIYFVLEDFDTLYHLIGMDLLGLIREARELGEYPAEFLKKL
jgi:phenylalanine-4-hydroxylase